MKPDEIRQRRIDLTQSIQAAESDATVSLLISGAIAAAMIEMAAQLAEFNEQFHAYRTGLAAAEGWGEETR